MERARALVQCDEGPEGEGWPDETIAVAPDVSARIVGRYSRRRRLGPLQELRFTRACPSRVALEPGTLDLPHSRPLAPQRAFGDPGQGLPFGGAQVPYVL